MFQTKPFVDALEQYARGHHIAVSTASRMATGNSDLADRIREGRVTIRTLNRLVQHLSDHWPTGVEWPAAIQRPNPQGENQ